MKEYENSSRVKALEVLVERLRHDNEQYSRRICAKQDQIDSLKEELATLTDVFKKYA